jgi:methionine sulfoxide reductase heme-binding subunit
LRTRIFKAFVLLIGLVPAALLVAGAFQGDLTANPIDYITDQTGTYALTFLFITLAVTPIRRLTGWNEIIRVRRMLGLVSFFYATLHMLTWLVLDQVFAALALAPDHFIPEFAGLMAADILKRPFITLGMTTYLLFVPLAVTSNGAMIRRMGRRWQTLHRLTYVAAITAVLHFWWLVKADVTEPYRWAAALTVLLGFRAWWYFRTRSPLRS